MSYDGLRTDFNWSVFRDFHQYPKKERISFIMDNAWREEYKTSWMKEKDIWMKQIGES